MKDEDLNTLTKKISEEFFGLPFKHRATFNHRLRTTGGRYMLSTHNIEINPKHYQYFGKEEIVAILKHELCHYHLHLQGRGYKHGDKDFKMLLKKVGGTRHCKQLPVSGNKKRTVHVYQCLSCQTEYKRYRRMDTSKYVCGQCKGKLKKVSIKA